MENLIKFLEEKITDKMPVEGIVDVFEQMCSTPLEEDMVLFETGTFTDFSKEPFFQISLVRQDVYKRQLPACLAGTFPTLQVRIFLHHIGVKIVLPLCQVCPVADNLLCTQAIVLCQRNKGQM